MEILSGQLGKFECGLNNITVWILKAPKDPHIEGFVPAHCEVAEHLRGEA